MHYSLRIKLITRMLGDQRNADKIRRFPKPGIMKGEIAMDLSRWSWLLTEALHSLNMPEIDVESVHMCSSFRSPTLEVFRRNWRETNRRTGKTRECDEMFESIRPGAELELRLFVTQTKDPGGMEEEVETRPPTTEELRKVFEVIGTTLGVSPWGSKFGYGRFEVLELDVI